MSSAGLCYYLVRQIKMLNSTWILEGCVSGNHSIAVPLLVGDRNPGASRGARARLAGGEHDGVANSLKEMGQKKASGAPASSAAASMSALLPLPAECRGPGHARASGDARGPPCASLGRMPEQTACTATAPQAGVGDC